MSLSFAAILVALATSSPPAPTAGGLSKQEINRVVDKALVQIKYCYDKQLSVDPTLAGKLMMFWDVVGDGSTSGVKVVSTTFPPPHGEVIGACVVRIISRLKFPPPAGGGVVHINYPFNFVGSVSPDPSKACNGGVPPTAIASVVGDDLSSLQGCYRSALQRTPTATGQVRATFSIATDGTLRDLQVVAVGNTLGVETATMISCVKVRMQPLRWPPSPERIVVPVDQSFAFGPAVKQAPNKSLPVPDNKPTPTCSPWLDMPIVITGTTAAD